MKVVTDAYVILDGIDHVKKQGAGWRTNCFFSENQIQDLIESESLYADSGDAWFALKNVCSQFDRFYFAVSSLDALDQALEQVHFLQQACFVTDLIGVNLEIQQTAETFRSNGYRDYAFYQRLTRLSDPNPTTSAITTIRFAYASEEDAPTIHEVICKSFDPFCDHFPALAEIREAVSDRMILVHKMDSSILGFCYFETVGLTSMIRYFWVAEACRGQGIGSSLMYRYFQENFQVRRFILWVNAANTVALSMYRRCGYKEDQLIDRIMIREA